MVPAFFLSVPLMLAGHRTSVFRAGCPTRSTRQTFSVSVRTSTRIQTVDEPVARDRHPRGMLSPSLSGGGWEHGEPQAAMKQRASVSGGRIRALVGHFQRSCCGTGLRNSRKSFDPRCGAKLANTDTIVLLTSGSLSRNPSSSRLLTVKRRVIRARGPLLGASPNDAEFLAVELRLLRRKADPVGVPEFGRLALEAEVAARTEGEVS